MSWLKESLVDCIALLIIFIYSFWFNNILEILIWGYSILLLLGKILYFFVSFLKDRPTKNTVPFWFYNLVYFLLCGLLFYSKNIYLGVTWIIIWGLSLLAFYQKKKK